MTKRLCALVIAIASIATIHAQVDTLFQSLPDSSRAKYDSLTFETGKILLDGGIAEVQVPSGFKYLNGKQSEYVLSQLWGNPPRNTLGMLFPEYANNYLPNTWAIEISFDEEGYVKDDDAKDIKYNELLTTMQEEVKETNKERVKQGYASVELLGWASPPFYDEKAKKLHWAKELMFEGSEAATLNYNIRVLGRKGVLVLNAIGEMSDLTAIKTEINPILDAVEFTSGNRYEDFNESTDKLAAYGIGGLIAGGVLAKTGLFAKIGLIAAKFAKVIFLGVAALGGGIWKWFSSRRKEDENPYAANQDDGDKQA